MELEIHAPDRVWASDLPDRFEKQFCVPGCHSGCIYPSDTRLVFEPLFRSTMVKAIEGAEGKRLVYKETIKKAG